MIRPNALPVTGRREELSVSDVGRLANATGVPRQPPVLIERSPTGLLVGRGGVVDLWPALLRPLLAGGCGGKAELLVRGPCGAFT
jgi:hypothetical protein